MARSYGTGGEVSGSPGPNPEASCPRVWKIKRWNVGQVFKGQVANISIWCELALSQASQEPGRAVVLWAGWESPCGSRRSKGCCLGQLPLPCPSSVTLPVQWSPPVLLPTSTPLSITASVPTLVLSESSQGPWCFHFTNA